MRRFIVTVIVFSIIFSSIYSGLWFYQSDKIKSFTETSMATLTKAFGGRKSEFAYSSTKIEGFPFNFQVTISQPRFIIDDKDVSMEIFSEQDLIITSNVIGTKYHVSLPKEIRVHNVTAASSLLLTYTRDANLYVKASFDLQDIASWIWSRNVSDADNFAFDLARVAYDDSGYNLVNTADQSTLSSATGSTIDIKKMGDNGYDVNLDLVGHYIKQVQSFDSDKAQLGRVDLFVDIEHMLDADAKTKTIVNALEMTSAIFSFDAKGVLQGSKAEALPYGDLRLNIGSYENFIDYKTSLINNVVQNSAFPIFRIKKTQSNAFKSFLDEVASEKYNENTDILVVLNRKEGEDVAIGDYNFSEAVNAYKRAAAGGGKRRISKK